MNYYEQFAKNVNFFTMLTANEEVYLWYLRINYVYISYNIGDHKTFFFTSNSKI